MPLPVDYENQRERNVNIGGCYRFITGTAIFFIGLSTMVIAASQAYTVLTGILPNATALI